MTKSIEDLRASKDLAHAKFTRTIANLFPGADEYEWYRAVDAQDGLDTERNADTSRDAAMAASMALRAAYAEYIQAVGEYHDAAAPLLAFYGKKEA